MRRREFITLLGGATAWPLTARAQQPAMPVVGFMTAGSQAAWRLPLAGFYDGLRESGYVEGQNISIEYRFAEGQFDRFSTFTADLVRRKVAVLVATSNPGAIAAKRATSTIPVVFSVGEDPVKNGIISSLNRPGGNMTGVYQLATELEAKRLGLLHEMVPKVALIAALINSNFSAASAQLSDLQEAAARLSVQLLVLRANVERDFEAAFTTLAQQRAGALLVADSPFFNSRREQLVVLAARHAAPTIYAFRDYAVAGGLMSYGTDLAAAYRQAGVYAGRILKGAKPADLPVVQATKFEFVINLNTAKALGIEVPPALSARADEVIE
jgi:putative ABC transport system substrate-binding protein